MERKKWWLSRPQNSTNTNLSPLYSYIKTGEERKVLYHYTSVESLLKIIANANMKFSRIDRVNDPFEKRSLLYDDLYKAVYIACFGHDENESIPLWKMYTPKGQGVRVGFFFKGPNIHDNFLDSSRTILDSNNSEVDWISLLSKDQEGTARMMIKDVQYSDRGDDFRSMSIQNGVVDVMPDVVGAYKTTIWEYEHETRIVLYLLDEDEARRMDSDYLIIPINTGYLERIEVRFDPWMSTELKRCIEQGFLEYSNKWGIQIDCADSNLCGRIQ